MTLVDIYSKTKNAPTMMGAEEETQFITLLMDLSVESIKKDWQRFERVINDLWISHTQAFFEVDSRTEPLFLRFADWLETIGDTVGDANRQSMVRQMAGDFRVNHLPSSEKNKRFS